jgi:hypothetical protein
MRRSGGVLTEVLMLRPIVASVTGRLADLRDAIAVYEAEDGEITDQEMAARRRADRDAAATVRARAEERWRADGSARP